MSEFTMTTSPVIRVVLLDDHPIIRSSFEIVFSKVTDIKLAASFVDSQALFAWLQKESPDILILDYNLGRCELDGLTLIKMLTAIYPQLKILLISSMESIAVIRAAYLLGIRGYLNKREEADVYLGAIRDIASGQLYMHSTVAQELTQLPTRKRDENKIAHFDAPLSVMPLEGLLTSREAEVVQFYLQGMRISEIAAKLKRSRKTISSHKQAAMKKLGINSDLELFKYRNDLFR